MLHYATLENSLSVARIVVKSRVLLRSAIAVKNQTREMFVAGYATLGNFSRRLCLNKIAKPVARNIA